MDNFHFKINNLFLINFHTLVISGILFLFAEWLLCFYRFFSRKNRTLIVKFIVFVLPFLIIWLFCIEPLMLVETHKTVYISRLPENFNNFKIVFVSDLHTGSPFNGIKKVKQTVKLVNKQNPDIVIFGGDFEVSGMIFSKYISANTTAPILGKIKSKYGTYSVLGNHDYFNGPKEIKNALEKNGIKVLDNQIVSISKNDEKLYIAGLGDFEYGDTDFSLFYNLATNSTVIAVVHEPDAFMYFPRSISLTLSGHTHGGQVRLPFIGSIKTPSAYGDKFSKGLVKENGKQIFITSGIGTSILPVRFLNPPEIAVITLKSAP